MQTSAGGSVVVELSILCLVKPKAFKIFLCEVRFAFSEVI